jgi:hypothetical protein
MVPTSLIFPIFLVAFALSAFAYFLNLPKRPLHSVKFVMMGGGGALMVLVVALAIIPVEIVWLSWLLLGIAIVWLLVAIQVLRVTLAESRVRERRDAEERARRA